MTHEILVVNCGGPGVRIPHWPAIRALDNTDNKLSPCQAYQKLLESSKSEVLIYIHDDVTIHYEKWLCFLEMFVSEEIAVVGLGGATRLGHPDLYKRPYRISDMARGGYMSNQTDWQTHGRHETGVKRVAVVDAFFLAVRRDLLVKAGGWPVAHLTHHCLDLWVCCEAARQGKEVWMVGAECTHHGGGTSVKDAYRLAKWLQGHSLEEDHRRPHLWLYSEYSDVLPIVVKS